MLSRCGVSNPSVHNGTLSCDVSRTLDLSWSADFLEPLTGGSPIALASFGALAYLFNSRSSFKSDIDVSSIQEVTRALAPKSDQANGGPNIIYIQHESLSGSILINTKKGQISTPFLQLRMANDPDLYVFEHHCTGSGNTINAMPSLMTGCLPYTERA